MAWASGTNTVGFQSSADHNLLLRESDVERSTKRGVQL